MPPAAIVGDGEEAGDNGRRGEGAVVEVEVVVADAVRDEVGSVVLGLVETYDIGEAKVLEDAGIVLWAELSITVLVRVLARS